MSLRFAVQFGVSRNKLQAAAPYEIEDRVWHVYDVCAARKEAVERLHCLAYNWYASLDVSQDLDVNAMRTETNTHYDKRAETYDHGMLRVWRRLEINL